MLQILVQYLTEHQVAVASKAFIESKGLSPLAKIIAHTTHSQEPKWFTTAPVGAIGKLLEKTTHS